MNYLSILFLTILLITLPDLAFSRRSTPKSRHTTTEPSSDEWFLDSSSPRSSTSDPSSDEWFLGSSSIERIDQIECAGKKSYCGTHCDTYKCCNKRSYSTTRYICCDGHLDYCGKECSDYKCCGDIAYISTRYICCGDKLITCDPRIGIDCSENMC